MASAFFEMMSVNYALPVAECDLKITSKQQYGIISGVWFAGSSYNGLSRTKVLSFENYFIKMFANRHHLNISFVGIYERHIRKKKDFNHCVTLDILWERFVKFSI